MAIATIKIPSKIPTYFFALNTTPTNRNSQEIGSARLRDELFIPAIYPDSGQWHVITCFYNCGSRVVISKYQYRLILVICHYFSSFVSILSK